MSCDVLNAPREWIRLAGEGESDRTRQAVHRRIALGEESVDVTLLVESARAPLDCIVPAARELASFLACRRIAQQFGTGNPVSCRKGCDACCSYLVPLSAPEAYRLGRELAGMPMPQRVRRRVALAAAMNRILQSPPPPADGLSPEALSRWQASLEMPCPLLRDHLCIAYDQRPLACREHMVTSDPAGCGDPKSPADERVPLPSVLEALARLAAELEGGEFQAVVLPLALRHAETHAERAAKLYPTTHLAQRFLAILEQDASRRQVA